MEDSVWRNLKALMKSLGIILYEKSLTLIISLFPLCVRADLRAIVAVHSLCRNSENELCFGYGQLVEKSSRWLEMTIYTHEQG